MSKKPNIVKLLVANNALLQVPIHCEHRRASNWMAVINVDGTAPGGLSRRWVPRGKGECYYLIEQLAVFDAVEFAADYTAYSGNKKPERWYGVILAATESTMVIEQCDSGAMAVVRANAARQNPADRRTALEAQRALHTEKAAELDAELRALDEKKDEKGAEA